MPEQVLVVLHRPNRRPWVCCYYLDDLLPLVDAVQDIRGMTIKGLFDYYNFYLLMQEGPAADPFLGFLLFFIFQASAAGYLLSFASTTGPTIQAAGRAMNRRNARMWVLWL